MSKAQVVAPGHGATPSEVDEAATEAADYIHLAAAPAFAIMAVLIFVLDAGSADTLCSVALMSPLSGMAPMYLLMTALHTAPSIKMISTRRGGPHRS